MIIIIIEEFENFKLKLNMEEKFPLNSLMLGLGIAGGFLVAWQGLYLGTKYARSGSGRGSLRAKCK